MFLQPGAISPPARLHSEERIPAKEALTAAFAEPLGLQGVVKARRTSFSSTVYEGNEIVTHGVVIGRPAHLLAHPSQAAEQIIRDFMKRWSLEVTFEESRAHLGIETQRQWSDRAIERSTPLLFSLFSLVALFGQALHPDGQIPVAQAAWYRKSAATFRDVLALIRRHLWGQGTFPTSPADPRVVLAPYSTLERLSLAVC